MAEYQKILLDVISTDLGQSVTSKCFDVYMEPLIEELLELWSRISTFDITGEEGLRNFTLQAMLI